jgi:hypothetical protein
VETIGAAAATNADFDGIMQGTPAARLSDCRLLLERLASWSKIVEQVRADPACRRLTNPNAKRQHERTLKQAETGMIALLLVMRHYQGSRPYTLGELASTIAGEKNTSSWKSAQQRIKVMLARVGDHYGLMRYAVVSNPRDGQICYQITASEKLVRFVENTLLTVDRHASNWSPGIFSSSRKFL